MFKFILSLYFILVVTFGFCQNDNNLYGQCEGSVHLFESGNYKLKLKGDKKESKTFDRYPAMENVKSSNQIWTSFTALERGTVSFSAKAVQSSLNFVVFMPLSANVCEELKQGLAEIKRFSISNETSETGLSESVTENYLYPIDLKEGEIIYIVFIANPEVDEMIDFSFDFKSEVIDLSESTKLLDFRSDDFSPYLKLTIRNAETGNPIIASTSLEGGKEIGGLYRGSDLFFNVERSTKLNFKCEAEGYFFLDSTEIRIYSTKTQEIIINLIPIASGKKMKLQDIDFIAGTSEISPSSEPRLKRLRDFLALNSELKIEITGHVFEPGTSNSNAGQKMSEARAKRVMKYLIDNGIDKSRLTSVGYGNTQPVYPQPLHTYEEQANRRVEVLVK